MPTPILLTQGKPSEDWKNPSMECITDEQGQNLDQAVPKVPSVLDFH